jgi:hypothetical protein
MYFRATRTTMYLTELTELPRSDCCTLVSVVHVGVALILYYLLILIVSTLFASTELLLSITGDIRLHAVQYCRTIDQDHSCTANFQQSPLLFCRCYSIHKVMHSTDDQLLRSGSIFSLSWVNCAGRRPLFQISS